MGKVFKKPGAERKRRTTLGLLERHFMDFALIVIKRLIILWFKTSCWVWWTQGWTVEGCSSWSWWERKVHSHQLFMMMHFLCFLLLFTSLSISLLLSTSDGQLRKGIQSFFFIWFWFTFLKTLSSLAPTFYWLESHFPHVWDETENSRNRKKRESNKKDPDVTTPVTPFEFIWF